jgi:hypothetical protein
MMDKFGRYIVGILHPAISVGLMVTSMKSPRYGRMGLGLGKATDVLLDASTRRSKT